MMKSFLLFIACFTGNILLQAQLVSGPMLGPVTHRTAGLWVELSGPGSDARLVYWPAGGNKQSALKAERINRKSESMKPEAYQILQFAFTGLEPATTYNYELTITAADKKPVKPITGSFTTQALWQLRNPAPDFSFIAGSCFYANETKYDRPGRAYGDSLEIFAAMAKEDAAFMLWLGDNWYLRDVDYSNAWGLWYRPHRDRSLPGLQALLRRMPHLAIWDDHDFGPNDYGSSYFLKEESREVFRQYWMNPSYGQEGKGIYTRYQYNDVDFFLLDDRSWRSFDNLSDSINGQPNPDKRMLGRQQMEWLKNELRYSKGNPFVSFRIIVVGSQVHNPASPFDKLLEFPTEYYELMHFIRDERIPGILFLNGDRHHSEIIRVNMQGVYPLYEITCSPLTSGTHVFGKEEKDNPWRVLGIDKLHNYGRITVSGAPKNRELKITFIDKTGKPVNNWAIKQGDLKWAD